ncbi:MAG TPA: ectoine hydroxylase [Segeticoccus sp.]|uniref:ectoine hydroxylase n=1 Tax=Segeticoccus sp. TaxID=2706531 RepID=UPI002D80CCD2|nr:ectoine hydroxylase [Segeticoccus sp.]HET8599854.1 ectoine hydroxylase [Segeticoccus sp.]
MPSTDPYPTRVASEPDVISRQGPVVFGGAADGPLGSDGLASVDQKGYVQVPDLVTPDEVEAMRAELSRLGQDREVLADERTVVEATSHELRSVFEVHRTNELFRSITHDPRLVDRARQVLGSDVSIHQSRVNFKPGFVGKDFSWHSDFETWHAEDGMPAPRAVSISVSLTENYTFNGPLMIMPGSHREYVSCVGATPDDNYKESLVMQGAGTPDPKILTDFADRYGIDVLTGSAGGATMFDSNCMHASNGNVTPFPRSNLFVVYNSVENACVEPFAASAPRPSFLASRDHSPIR